jgi:hypothetical protein
MGVSEESGLAELISSLADGRLAERGDLSEPCWRFWERRNLNMHRLVGLWSLPRTMGATELNTEARAAIGRHFHRAWWRGLAWGVVVEVPDIALSSEDLKELIDVRENVRGTWQWLVLVSGAKKTVLGAHTWTEGYLSPVYRGLLSRLQERGFQVTSVRREKDGLMKILTAARPRAFPEFQDEFQHTRSV